MKRKFKREFFLYGNIFVQNEFGFALAKTISSQFVLMRVLASALVSHFTVYSK